MKITFNVFIRIAFAIVIVYFTLNVVRIIYEVNEAQREMEEFSEDLEVIEEKVAKLKYRYEMPVDESYLEKVAKENGYHSPDEVVFYNNYNNGGK